MSLIPPQSSGSPVQPVTTTTTAPKGKDRGKGNANSVVKKINGIISSGTGGFSTGGATSTNVPGVTSKLAGDLLPFTLPHQLPWFQAPSGSLITNSDGSTSVTYSTWMSMLHQIQGNPTLLDRVQHALYQAGYLPKSFSHFGTVDTATQTAWERMGQDAIGAPLSTTSLLNAGMQEGNLQNVISSLTDKRNTAQYAADAASSVNVNLTDPNEIAQKFATAMESMGLGAPTQEQANRFASLFQSSEVAAAQNQSHVQHENYLAGAGNIGAAINAATQGNLQGATAAENYVGPTYVATKSMPNLDAESIAAAKAQNPGMYYATGSTYLYGMIQQMLGGQMQLPTSPQSPTSQTTGGAILTTPLGGGAM